MTMLKGAAGARATRKWALAGAASLAAFAAASPALAQQAAGNEEIIVTGSRRAVSVQDVPVNISAVSADTIEEQGFRDLGELLEWVPGAHLVDMGGRDSNLIVVRGLNANPLGSSEGVGTAGGGTVATYVGDIPLGVDLRLNDIERVEVLLGPQGTLYGAGTLGGAIRYIPNRPQFTEATVSYRADVYQYSEADSESTDIGLTANIPLGSSLAMRFSIDRLADSGFIDYTKLVNTIGVSNPNIVTPGAPGFDLHTREDANSEDVLSGRVAFRWQPTDWLDSVLTYHFQDYETGARQISSRRSTQVAVGEYESSKRVLEPNHRHTDLLSLETTVNLGFAELTSATGYSWYEEAGQRDQTDLLIGLQYSYELFPAFTGFTHEYLEEEQVTQEIRLVSTGNGPWNWIVGGFYSTFNSYGLSQEFTPFFDAFAFGGVRTDDLEFISVDYIALSESAIFGEVGYKLTDAWQVTVGGRWYEYDLDTQSGSAPPIFDTFNGLYPDGVVIFNFNAGGQLAQNGQTDEGFLYKFNTSYEFSPDIMGYLTVSEGYRIGGGNGAPPCILPLPPGQNLCALPDELSYTPDKTTNYELGLRTQWFDRRLTLNTALFWIDWEDPQLAASTVNGVLPITKNGEGAVSRGFEINFNAEVTDHLTIRGSYANTSAQLTDRTVALLNTFDPLVGPNFGLFTVDGEKGDRLPGSAQHQGSLFVSYNLPMANGLEWDFSYGVAGISEVLTRTGGRAFGATLPGYILHDAAVELSANNWSITLYANNIFDEYAESGAVGTPLSNQYLPVDTNGDPVLYRTHYTSVLPPRRIGVRFAYEFGG